MIDSIEWWARKLEPLEPQRVRRWLQAYPGADPELRLLLDRQIMAEARKYFPHPRNSLILSLPPQNAIRGPLNLGTVLYDGKKWPAGLHPSELLSHLGIYGRSGAGKTNLVFHLLRQLEQQGVPWLFLDFKRTARHLIPRLRRPVKVFTPGRALAPLAFNPFMPPEGVEARTYGNHVIDVLADAYILGEGARRMVQKALGACAQQGLVAPSISELLHALEQLPDKGRSTGWKLTALRALESLAFAIPGSTTENDSAPGAEINRSVAEEEPQKKMTRMLMGGNTIIELDGLPGAARAFWVPLLLYWIFQMKLGQPRREQLELVIILEEAHHVLYRQEHRARETLVNTLLRQCRELSIAFVVVDQHPHLISSAALGNCFATVCLNLKDPADVSRAAALALMEDSEKTYFGRLPVGQGIVKLQDRWTQPFLIQIPHVPHAKGAMTDSRLRQYLASQAQSSVLLPMSPSGFLRNWASQGVMGQIPQFPPLDDELGDGRETSLDEHMLQFMEDVLAHPDDGVRGRYRRLGLSGRRGHRIQQALVVRGWLEREVIPLGRTRKVLLRLSRPARRMLNLDDPSTNQRRESLAHVYWKNFYARWLERQGYKVTVEAARPGGFVDVLGKREGQTLAVEVETGRSDVVGNVRGCLKARINQVVVVATTPEAQTKVERSLAQAGLLLPRRVRIIQGGDAPAEGKPFGSSGVTER